MRLWSVWMLELGKNPEILQKQLSQLLHEILTSATISHQLFKILYFEY